MRSLENRIEVLENAAGDQNLCTDPKCLHMDFLRLDRRAHGLPEYPLPPHSAAAMVIDLAEALASLSRRHDETAEQHAERRRYRPERYFDPYFKAWGKPVDDGMTPAAAWPQCLDEAAARTG